MNQSKTQYENALSNLSNSHYAIAPDAILKEDSQAGVREIGKTITSDFGNILLGHVATQALGTLGKMGNQLSKLGINSSDAKVLSKAIANGDRRKVGQMIAKLGSKKVKLGIKKLTGKSLTDEELPDAVEEQIDKNIAESSRPIQVSEAEQPIARFAGDTNAVELQSFTTTPKKEVWLGESDDEDEDEAPSRPSQAQPEPEDEGEDEFQDAVEDQATKTESEVSTVSKVASTGEDVATGLDDATLLSTTADDTGVGLLLTAGLGIASLFTGLFMKSKKPKVVQPPLIAPNNFSIQAGIS